VGDSTVRKSVGDFVQALHSNFSSIFTRFRYVAADRRTETRRAIAIPRFAPYSVASASRGN